MAGRSKKPGFFRRNWPMLLSGTILLLLVGGYFVFPFYREGVDRAWDVISSKDESRIEEWVDSFGLLGPVVLVLLMVVQMFLLFVPNVLVMMIAIIMYGPIWGSVISLLGVLASSSFGYMIGNKAGPYTVKKLVNEKILAKMQEFLEQYGAMAIGITRLASLSNDSLSIAVGMLRMSYKKYILATIAGITPLVVLLAIFGENGKIEKALFWIAGLSFALLVGYIILDKRRKRKGLSRRRAYRKLSVRKA
jgi:uncharacterized membrane protein YdjX (TVP38/TMEM64 family)